MTKLFKHFGEKFTEKFMTNQIDLPKLSTWFRSSTLKTVGMKKQPVQP